MENFGYIVFGLLWYTLLILLPGAAFAIVLHFLLSLPGQRRDRALFFLDLIETALDRGQSVERSIVSAAETRDRAMGLPFYVVAAHIENGVSLGGALEKVPGYLPPQLNAMLRAGEKLGDIKKTLPACREVLRIAPNTLRTTLHYMVAILLLFAPIAIWLISLLMIFVVPKFKEVFAGMGVKFSPLAIWFFVEAHNILRLEALIFFALITVAIIYIGGPRFVALFQSRAVPIVDWITWRIPWKHKKLLRAFSAMLAVLLDGGVPEAEAVRLAGESTANEICRRRALRVIAALGKGEKLTDAIRLVDRSGEFQWRLANAACSRSHFLDALRGWHEALDAKAFQQEETATHALTSGLVILNGIIVGLVAVSMFGMLVLILKNTLAAT